MHAKRRSVKSRNLYLVNAAYITVEKRDVK